jgi:hypothetical protein
VRDHDRLLLASSENPNWRTPKACYAKLDQHFKFTIDLAADAASCLTPNGLYFGPGSPDGEDALAVSWVNHIGFLNPAYSRTLATAYRTGKYRQKDGTVIDWPVDLAQAKANEIDNWAEKAFEESQRGATVVGLFPFAPQTDWYRRFVYGYGTDLGEPDWLGHAAMAEWRLSHRISYEHPDGKTSQNANVNSVVIVWEPNPGFVGCWQPAIRYWSYR